MAGVPIAFASCADFEECDLSLVASLLTFCSIIFLIVITFSVQSENYGEQKRHAR